MAQTTNPTLAESLLKAALGFGGTNPDITQGQIDILMEQANTGTEEAPVFAAASLNAAAAQGWRWKAALASPKSDDKGGGTGVYVKRAQGLTERWVGFANSYANGLSDVLGGTPPGSALNRRSRSVPMVGSLAADDVY